MNSYLQRLGQNGRHQRVPSPEEILAINEGRLSLDDLTGELSSDKTQPPKFDVISLDRLIAENPKLNEPVIHGVVRRREVANIIAKSKVGKSWFGYGMALCIAAGWDWLGRFRTTRGRVLLIDNELHRSVLAHRIPQVQQGLSMPDDFVNGQFDVVPMRGKLRDINSLGSLFADLESDTYSLILIDALYRMLPSGMSENDNAAMAAVYNQLQLIAELSGAAVAVIHHATKGSQNDKDVVDVGAGAGSQSRAADTHLILRPHEESNCVVLEAVVRSFAPVDALGLRWQFPLWLPDSNLNPAKLKGRPQGREQRQVSKDAPDKALILEKLKGVKLTARKLRPATGIGPERLQRLLDQLCASGDIKASETKNRGNICNEYSLA